MSTPAEGLNAMMFLGTACPAGTADTIALFTGVDLSWTQEKRRWYHMGSMNHYYVLDGVIAWEGSFRKAYTSNRWLGTFHLGTYAFCGSIVPRYTAGSIASNSPAILGTIKLMGGSLRNMETETVEAVEEEESFIIYNMTFVG